MAESHAQPRPSRRRVPRWVWFVVTCVSFGAVTSVGVAWVLIPQSTTLSNTAAPVAGYTLRPEGPDGYFRLIRISQESSFGRQTNHFGIATNRPVWPDEVPDDKAAFDRLTVDAASEAAVRRHTSLQENDATRWMTFSVQLSGWPFLCLGCEDAFTGNERRVTWLDRPEYPKSNAPPDAPLDPTYFAIVLSDRMLPMRPLWPGLLANTAIYGGAWAVLIGVPIFLRRWLRARRGGCPQCGYSREGLKVDAPCPECGRAATTTSA
jgi:hypothetical protein